MRDVTMASRLVAKIAGLQLDDYTLDKVSQLENALELMPMDVVLKRIKATKGATVEDKCRMIGVTRNTWYTWLRGEYRPNKIQAARLEKLTKIPAERFQGRR
jgi:hypothetical protein